MLCFCDTLSSLVLSCSLLNCCSVLLCPIFFALLCSDLFCSHLSYSIYMICTTIPYRHTEAGVEKAFALWEQMLSLSTHAFWCYPLLGQYYLCKGVFDKGEKPFQKALELHPLDAVRCGSCTLLSHLVLSDKIISLTAAVTPLSLKDTSFSPFHLNFSLD